MTGILVYIVLQLLIGVWVARKVRSSDDYLLAGRQLGYWLATFSIFATWFGAESCIGTAGAAYEHGWYGVTADPFGYAVCLVLMALVFAVPLYKLNLTTVADFMKGRFSASTARLAAVLMIPSSIFWAAAQIRAFGLVLSFSSGYETTLAITISAGIVIVYTSLGGLLADAVTDLVQGIVLVAGLVIIAIMVAGKLPGETLASGLAQSVTTVEGPSLLRMIEDWAIPVCGSLFAQELVARILATRSPVVARRSTVIAAFMYLLIGCIPLAIGLVARVLPVQPQDPELILPTIAASYLPTLVYTIFSGAMLSAILSTVDSALLACAALTSQNIISPGVKFSDNRKLQLNRALVVVSGLGAWGLAIHAEGVYELVKDASAVGSAGIFVVIVMGLFTKLGNSISASAALITGAMAWLVSTYLVTVEYPYLLALLLAFLSYFFCTMPFIRSRFLNKSSRPPIL